MNNLKFAFRSFRRQPLNSIVSLLGLTFGLACFMLVTLYLQYEKGHDAFHKDSDRIYRIVENRVEDGQSRKVASIGPQVGIQTLQQLSGVEAMSQVIVLGRLTLGNDLALRDYEEIWVVDSSFFELFSFPLVVGEGKSALQTPDGLLLSESLARKHFNGDLPALGDSIWNSAYTAQVSGIFSVPKQSHLQFDMIMPAEVCRVYFDWWDNFILSNWENNSFNTYIRLSPKTNPKDIERQITDLVRPHYGKEIAASTFELQPLTSIHFEDKAIEGSLASNTGQNFYVYLLSILGFMVLLVAAFNYTNISTAIALKRTREIGLRKTVGASKFEVVRQFLTESLVMTGISMFLAIFLSDLLIPTFNEMMGTSIEMSLFLPSRWLLIAGISVLVAIISSLYPAWVVSKVNPAKAIREKHSLRTRGFSIRKVLVIGQFAAAILMIISTMVIHRQLNYMRNIDMGFNLEGLLVADINSGNLRSNFEAIKQEMVQVPGVSSVSVTSRVPGEWKISPVANVSVEGRNNDAPMRFVAADEDFLTTFKVSLLQGENFAGMKSDSLNVLINQTAMEQLGISVGETIVIDEVNWAGDIQSLEEPFRARVIGVVKDFYFESFRQELGPMVIGFRNNPIHNIDYFTIRLSGTNVAEQLNGIKAVNQNFDPNNPLEYHFLNQQFERYYSSDEQRARVFLFFSLVVLFIACMGLFALTAHEIRYRLQEVGIRKVLGASVVQIINLFAFNFIKLILIAFVLALPAGWWVAHTWLEEFAHRINMDIWMMLVPGLITLGLALLTVAYITFKAADSNPVNVLRD